MLVVLGEDIGDYTLQGYQDGGCDPGKEIGGVSCTVTRSETTLDAVLDRLCRFYQERYGLSRGDRENAFDAVPFEIYRGTGPFPERRRTAMATGGWTRFSARP